MVVVGWDEHHPFTGIALIAGIPTIILLFVIVPLFRHGQSLANLPLINGKERYEISYSKVKQRFFSNALSLVNTGFAKSRNAFRMETDDGLKLVITPRYANDIRNDDRLSFMEEIREDFPQNIPGFEPFMVESQIFMDLIKTKLTQSLRLVTEPLSDETTDALQKIWGDDPDWHEIVLKQSILGIVAQISSRIFLGPDLCHNPDWLRITIDYTVNCMIASHSLRQWPRPLRHIVHWFLPHCKILRDQVRDARNLITPIIEERKAQEAALIREGKVQQECGTDAIAWMEEIANGRPYDPAVSQLSLGFVAIHTTSDMLTQVVFDLCGKEELIQALREEVINVIGTDGWKKSSLYRLKLMDSVLKESQRMKPITYAVMRRLAIQPVQLPDGTEIPKGTSLFVSSHNMRDPSIYPDPDTFDGYRFFNLRQVPGHENSSQLVSTSAQHLGFGHGQHACPGRFFAANEVKIALCHMVLKYDWKAVDNSQPTVEVLGFRSLANSKARIALRRRQEEISL